MAALCVQGQGQHETPPSPFSSRRRAETSQQICILRPVKKIINRASIWKAAPTKVSKKTKLSQKDGASARIQKEELEKEEIMSVGAPAGTVTALLVLLAAFLAALCGPGFRKGNALPAVSAFCIRNPSPVLHLRWPRRSAGQRRGKTASPHPGHMPL